MENVGLTSVQARERLAQYGLNQLPGKSGSNILFLLLSQFNNFLVWLLLAAAGLSFFVGDFIDGFLILVILLLNSALGFWQEFKASKELEALRAMEVSVSRVLRDGTQIEISSYEIVPGDVVIVESGDKIPADGHLIESFDLAANEAALTGESLPVAKTASKDDGVLYFGSTVSSGRGKILIEQTGINTRFGKIALTLSNILEEPTPLENSLKDLALKIGILAVIISIFLAALRYFQGEQILEVIFTSIAMMVAAVPEGLPAVITVLLALGVRRMYKKKTIVRKLSAIESLGATSVVLTDKTGTLTKNQMSVRKIFTDKSNLSEMLRGSVICNSASLVMKEDLPGRQAGHGGYDILGDTTEGALLIYAKNKGLDIEEVRSSGKIEMELPFDLKRRRMSVLWAEGNKLSLFCKGAPEVILSLCKLTPSKHKELTTIFETFAKEGLRVIAVAKRDNLVKGVEKDLEKNLKFLGFIDIADAPREEASLQIEKLTKAGIAVVMITVDNELTAKAIAEEVGLLRMGDEVMTGAQLDELSDDKLLEKLPTIKVFARVVPEHKLRVVTAYQQLGKVVAVTGDGVNDALALKAAHVGIAMGDTGTDVAKQAADIVILDDNLTTIVDAVEQGRLIYSNIIKTVKFLMTGNLSEVLVIVGAAVIGFPTPLLPAQILWINFVTDGFPALALSADEASDHIMRASPRDPNKSILDQSSLKFILGFGISIAVINLAGFTYLYNFYNLDAARSFVFTGIVITQMIMIFIMRRHHSIWSNKYLLAAVGFVLLMQLAIITIPQLRVLFSL